MTRKIYIFSALLILLIAMLGFWRTYYGPAFNRTIVTIPLIHIHAAVYLGWVMFFIVQVVLASTRRVALHMKLGKWLMLYGIVVIVMGLTIALERFGHGINHGDVSVAQRKLFGPLRDMVFFSPFLWSGWHWRKSPEIHKRVMLVATNILLVAAVSRMHFLGNPVPEWKFLLVWPLPVYVAMIHDYISKKIVHPVYLIGIACMAVMRIISPFRGSPAWIEFCEWLAKLFR